MIKWLRYCVLAAIVMAGQTHVLVGSAQPLRDDASLCEQARHWHGSTTSPPARVAPIVNEGDRGRSYHFDLGGKGGLQTLDADCGWGSYADCEFTARTSGGKAYQFSDLSTFEVWEAKGGLYLLYRIVAPKDEAARSKRRVVRVGQPPIEICNQIGDYADLL